MWSTGSNGRGRCWKDFPKARGDVNGFPGENKNCFNNKKKPWNFRKVQHRSQACINCVQWIFLKNFQNLHFTFLHGFSITLEKMQLLAIKYSTINITNLIWLPIFWEKRKSFESAKGKKPNTFLSLSAWLLKIDPDYQPHSLLSKDGGLSAQPSLAKGVPSPFKGSGSWNETLQLKS